MEQLMVVKGSIPDIIKNSEGLYLGDLKQYFKIVFNKARNLGNPYHNFRHMFHVLWLCYQACNFYKDVLSPREMRNLLIAAMFHDFDHSGRNDHDSEQIKSAILGLQRHVLEEDAENISYIINLILATEFPYKIPSSHLILKKQILRDADLSQVLNVAWIQHIVFGLAEEWGKAPMEILQMQEGFLNSLQFNTEWAKTMFPKENIKEKIEEVREILSILEE
ncbi:MAG: hypothetical protein ABIJ28_01020 [Patescibacteria group bacterium]